MEEMKRNSGQALLIILLVMAVGLTIGLAIVSRSVTDITISRQEEESARVFSVAEAGIEEALKAGASFPAEGIEVPLEGVTATVRKSDLGGQLEFAFPGEYVAGNIETLWLVAHEEDGDLNLGNPPSRYSNNSIEVYWGKESGTIVPSLEATLIYNQSGTKIIRWALDPDSSRGATNKFDLADLGSFRIGEKTFRYKKTLNLPCGESGVICYALRLRLLYNDQPQILGVKGVNNIPKQGVCYESTATLGGGGITRKVRQCQFYKAPVGIFDYVLYSRGDLRKE